VDVIKTIFNQTGNRALALGTHLVMFFLFSNLIIFLSWLFGISIGAFTMPVSFVLYIIAFIFLNKYVIKQSIRSVLVDIGMFVVTAVGILSLGVAVFSQTHDTSYDGQAYHQSAIISFIHGWNPLYDTELPSDIIKGTPYVNGYPKLFWQQYAALALTTGNLNTATVINVLPIVISFCFVYCLVFNVLKLRKWAIVIALMSVLSIYSAQQIFTFMADGTSYQIGVAAIAVLCAMLFTKKSPWKLLIPFAGLMIILVGTKFNNATLVILLAIIFLAHVYVTRLFLQRSFWRYVGAALILAVILLWSPFMTNYLRQSSFIYPQNLSEPQATLKRDNIPPNIISNGPISQLFYGVFSKTQPLRAGDYRSAENVAELKIPFTFSASELDSAGDFLGRLSSPGVLFGGIVIASIVLLLSSYLFRKSLTHRDKIILKYAFIAIGLLILLGLVNPVPNKLRYAPFITLIPIIAVISSLLISQSRRIIIVLIRVFIVTALFSNIIISTVSIASLRSKDFNAIQSQRTELKQKHEPIRVVSNSFNSVVFQLQSYGVDASIVKSCLKGERKVPIVLTFQTAYYCTK
jgi:hypothetical protein